MVKRKKETELEKMTPEEERAYWDAQDPLRQGKRVRVQRPQPPEDRLSYFALRLSGKDIGRLAQLAQEKGMKPSELARALILQGLGQAVERQNLETRVKLLEQEVGDLGKQTAELRSVGLTTPLPGGAWYNGGGGAAVRPPGGSRLGAPEADKYKIARTESLEVPAMNNIRPAGMNWFRRNVHDLHVNNEGEHIKVSKYYPAAESWTSSEVWWFDIPLEKVSKPSPDHMHLLCQSAVSSQDFFHLKVPKSVLQDAANRGRVEVTPQSIIRLHLSARSADRFLDIRAQGPFRLDLAGYLQ